MKIRVILNGKTVEEEIREDLTLLDFVRAHGCFSVKQGCGTSSCGLCTVFLSGKPVLSCSVLAARQTDAGWTPWKASRKRRLRLWDLSQIRGRSSVVSAIREW